MSILKKSLAIGAAAAIAAVAGSAAEAAVNVGTITTTQNKKSGYNVSFALSEPKAFDIAYTVNVTANGKTTVRAGIAGGTITSATFNGKTLTPSANSQTGALTFDYLAKGTYTFTVAGVGTRGGLLTGSVSLLPAAVPEPASWALMIGGVGVAGGMLRRRSRSATRQVALA